VVLLAARLDWLRDSRSDRHRGRGVGFCHSLNRLSGTKTDGEEIDMWLRATVCFRKIDGKWTITHRHESVPFYMDGSYKAAVDLKPYFFRRYLRVWTPVCANYKERIRTVVTRKGAAENADRELVVPRIFDVPRRLVFRAWTEPEHLGRWQGAPQGFTETTHRMDIRLGGAYRVSMRSPEGVDYWLQGIHREIEEPERARLHPRLARCRGETGQGDAGDHHVHRTRREDRAHLASDRLQVGRVPRWAQGRLDQYP
jgi:activator of Hsp90 ATPase-like protein/SnoaL-like protein